MENKYEISLDTEHDMVYLVVDYKGRLLNLRFPVSEDMQKQSNYHKDLSDKFEYMVNMMIRTMENIDKESK